MADEISTELNRLRNNIDFASVAQFFHTFQSAFRPWPVAHDPTTFYAHANFSSGRGNKQSNDDYVFTTEVHHLSFFLFPFFYCARLCNAMILA